MFLFHAIDNYNFIDLQAYVKYWTKYYCQLHFWLIDWRGAICDANTFDGERCVYGALTNEIKYGI